MGLFGNFLQDDPGYAAPQGGVLSGYGPMAGNQKAALLFAGLRDAVGSFSGGPPTNYAGQQGQQISQQNQLGARKAVNDKIQAAYATGDMNKVRQALVEAAGIDPDAIGHITQALQFGQPKIQDIGGAGYSIDPLSGNPTEIVPARPKAPLISNGMQSSDNGKTWTVIPGYVDQQAAVAGARRAPPKAVAGPMGGNPASLFGGR